jgi:hypothetical protein
MAIDPKHLPEDPKILQQMVLDLMGQLDREFTERHKIESLLRELLDAKRGRKSERLFRGTTGVVRGHLASAESGTDPPGHYRRG